MLTGTLDLTGRDVQRDVTLKIGQLQETISVWASRGRARQVTAAPAAARRAAHDKTAAMKACAEKAPAAGQHGRQPQASRSKLVDVKPRYPQELAAAGTGGVFVFAARIGTDGTISDLQTTSGIERPISKLAAANAIRQWEFTPTLLNCVAIEVPMTITVSFRAQ